MSCHFYTGEITVLVECGVLSRQVTFMNGGNDISNLQAAITRQFHGLKESYIAMLQAESTNYHGHYIDILDQNMEIEPNGIIKVLLFSEVSR